MLDIVVQILLDLLRLTIGYFIGMDEQRENFDENQALPAPEQPMQIEHDEQEDIETESEGDHDDQEDIETDSEGGDPEDWSDLGSSADEDVHVVFEGHDVHEYIGTPHHNMNSQRQNDDDKDKSEKEVAEPEPDKPGCKHYQRKCQVVCPLDSCGKIYTCRLCHDETETSHKLDRHGIREVVCMECNTRQPVAATCQQCSVVFGEYFCSVCNLFMSPNPDKPPYHCEPCHICRIGPKDHFFHCENCDMCLPISTKGKHRCIEKSSRNDCAVCLEDIHSARNPAHLPPCGHLIHMSCYHQMLRNALYTCPLCNESMIEMTNIWSYLDEQIASSPPLPPEYANKNVTILCRDCHKFSTILFHFVGLKCGLCGGYNTTLEKGIDFHPLADNLETPIPPIAPLAEGTQPVVPSSSNSGSAEEQVPRSSELLDQVAESNEDAGAAARH